MQISHSCPPVFCPACQVINSRDDLRNPQARCKVRREISFLVRPLPVPRRRWKEAAEAKNPEQKTFQSVPQFLKIDFSSVCDLLKFPS